MIVPDRTLNTLLKDVVLKGVVVVFSSQSPTKNKEAAIQKMLEAGDFIANYGVTMDQDSFNRLGEDSVKLVGLQHDVSTGWGDLFAHPVNTYRSARQLKARANALLFDAKSASCQSKINQAGEARAARAAVRRTRTAPPIQAPQHARISPEQPANGVAPVTLFPPAPPTDFDKAAGDCAYIRLGEFEMKIPLDSRTRIGFDGGVLTTSFRAGPIKPQESAPDNQPVGAVKRTASVFAATGTARIVTVPQPDTDASPNHDEEVSTPCKLEWLEGPVITALTDLEGGEPEAMDSGSDSDLSSD